MAAETLFASPESSDDKEKKTVAYITPIDLICNGIWSHVAVCMTEAQVFIQ